MELSETDVNARREPPEHRACRQRTDEERKGVLLATMRRTVQFTRTWVNEIFEAEETA